MSSSDTATDPGAPAPQAEHPPGWLPKDEYDAIYRRVPRLCVEVVLTDSERGVVLARRDIPPNIGAWHIPGGTVLWGESLTGALHRVASSELGVEITPGGLLGWIEYPSHVQAGIDSPIGIAFECALAGSSPASCELPEGVCWFTSLPEGLYAEQREFLGRRLGFA